MSCWYKFVVDLYQDYVKDLSSKLDKVMKLNGIDAIIQTLLSDSEYLPELCKINQVSLTEDMMPTLRKQ